MSELRFLFRQVSILFVAEVWNNHPLFIGFGFRCPAAAPNRLPKSTNDVLKSTFLLLLSNAFMTFAWYAHLKNLREKPWVIAALVSWGIAFF